MFSCPVKRLSISLHFLILSIVVTALPGCVWTHSPKTKRMLELPVQYTAIQILQNCGDTSRGGEAHVICDKHIHRVRTLYVQLLSGLPLKNTPSFDSLSGVRIHQSALLSCHCWFLYRKINMIGHGSGGETLAVQDTCCNAKMEAGLKLDTLRFHFVTATSFLMSSF